MEALRDLLAQETSDAPLDAIDRADLEATVEDRLLAAGVTEPWTVASAVVEAGLGPAVDEIVREAGPDVDGFLAVLLAHGDVASLLHTVEEGTRRMSAIVRALKSYSYLDQGPVQQVDLIAGIEDTLLILRSKLEGIDVRREYHPDLPSLEARGGELNQVWTNLIDNAADAIHSSDGGGTITIRAHPANGSVAVEIEDDGTGISPEHRDRIFDSFFTTKPPGGGTGLGLSITWGIVVDSHHGDITVESEPGRTVFRVVLPLTASD
jgi:signal transduction histidine kinase